MFIHMHANSNLLILLVCGDSLCCPIPADRVVSENVKFFQFCVDLGNILCICFIIFKIKRLMYVKIKLPDLPVFELRRKLF